MTCRRAVYIFGCAYQRLRSQWHKIENAYWAISNQLYTIFFVIFQRISAKFGLYIGITSCINPVNFQVRTPNVKVTVWHNRNLHDIVEIIAQYTLHTFFQRDKKPRHRLSTYFLPTRQKAKTSFIHVPGRFDQELGWWKPTKTKVAQQCITLYTTIHHSMLCYYFRHTTDFIGQNTRGRSPHASLDINTTSNYCPVSVSLARVAQLVERQTPDSEVPGSNPTNTQLFFVFFSSFVESMFNTTPKSHF